MYRDRSWLKLVTIQAINDMVNLETCFVLQRAATSNQSLRLNKWIPPDGLDLARRN